MTTYLDHDAWTERTCVLEGCEYSGQLRRKMCPRHYYRWKQSDPSRGACSVDGCGRPFYAKSYCSRHYSRFQIYGDPEMPVQPKPQYETTGRIVHAIGYVLVRVAPGDWQYEHRVIWKRVNGPIPDGYHIHHINGDRADNRLENLELVNGARHNREHTTQRHRNGSLDNRGANSGMWRHDLDAAEIVRRRDAGESFRAIGRSMNTDHSTIKLHYDWSTKGVMA